MENDPKEKPEINPFPPEIIPLPEKNDPIPPLPETEPLTKKEVEPVKRE